MEWNRINREKLSLYYENKDPTVPLPDNKEFRSIKNMIIKAVSEMSETLEPVIITELEKTTDDETIQICSQTTEETTATEIVVALARLIGDKCMAHRQSLQEQIVQRLKQEINEKKLAMGLKTERTQKASYQTEETYEMSM